MRRIGIAIGLCVAALLAGTAVRGKAEEGQDSSSRSNAPVRPPVAKDKFHLFLLIGQSNMAGRGKVETEDKTPHARVWTLSKEGQWVPAVDPIHSDKKTAGVGPSVTFGKVLAEADPSIHVGLIPCAFGGTDIAQWAPDQKLRNNAIERARKAMESGTLSGILWHQGESDASPERVAVYEEKLKTLVADFRTTLGVADVPFIAGEIGRWYGGENGRRINEILNRISDEVKHAACVSSEGLKNQDAFHFDTASQRELGRRYAAAYRKLRL